MPPNPKADRITERTSIGTLFVSPRLRIQRAPAASASSAIGSTTAKMERQPTVSSRKPERVGPIAGASEITTLTRPIMRPRDCAGTTVMIVVISSGNMIAVPEACTTRATSSTGKPGASSAISVPAENRVIAATNMTRVVKRCSRKPVIGMTTAIVSMNDVVSHCACSAVMSRSTMRCGIATPIVVSLRMATNAADSSSQMTRFCSRVRAGPLGAGTRMLSVPGFVSVAAIGRLLVVFVRWVPRVKARRTGIIQANGCRRHRIPRLRANIRIWPRHRCITGSSCGGSSHSWSA